MMNRTKALSKLWEDNMDIHRVITTRNKFKESIETLQLVKAGIRCKLSNKILRSEVDGSLQTSRNEYKVFTDPSVDVRQNDVIKLTRCGAVYNFKAIKPFVYPNSHLELVVEEVAE